MSNEELGLVTFSPTICADKVIEKPTENGGVAIDTVPAKYKGTVTIKMPDYDARMDLLDEIGSVLGDKPGASEDELAAQGRKLIREAAKRAGRFVRAVDLTRIEDGYKFTSWDQVRADYATHSVVSEVGQRLVGRYELGKA